MIDELTLDLSLSDEPDRIAVLRERMMTALRDTFPRGRWIAGHTLASWLGTDERSIRAAAANSRGEILSGPGERGYKLTREATQEEVNRVMARLHSQALAMARRAGQIRRVYHDLAGKAAPVALPPGGGANDTAEDRRPAEAAEAAERKKEVTP